MIWFRPYTFAFRGKLGPALQALTRSIERDPGRTLYIERVERRVKVAQKMRLFRCAAFAVRFVGHLDEDGANTVLKGYFRPPLLLLWCLGGIEAVQLLGVLCDYSVLDPMGPLAQFYDRILRPSRTVAPFETLLGFLALPPLALLGWVADLPAEFHILGALEHFSEDRTAGVVIRGSVPKL